jgi:transaldolase
MESLKNLKVAIYADGASPAMIRDFASLDYIAGFTTNPSLLKQAGIRDYMAFAKEVCTQVKKPISFEVITDDLDEMIVQGRLLRSLGPDVFVKIPVQNALGDSTDRVIQTLANEKTKLNITMLFTVRQVARVVKVLNTEVPAIVSVFAGRVADTGRDPIAFVRECRKVVTSLNHLLLWASTRELYNVVQAAECGCDIITMGPDFIKKLPLLGRNLEDMSLEGVQTFQADVAAAGLFLSI